VSRLGRVVWALLAALLAFGTVAGTVFATATSAGATVRAKPLEPSHPVSRVLAT